MLKAIVNFYNCGHAWVEQIFPGYSLATLPLADKPAAEYMVDALSQCGVTDVRMLDYAFDPQLHAALGDGSRWSLSLQYTGTKFHTELTRLIAENLAFIGDDEVIIMSGTFLPGKFTIESLRDAAWPLAPEQANRDGIYLYRQGKLFFCPAAFAPLNSLRAFFTLNMLLLNDPGHYVLPGYSAENGVYAGMNTMIMQNCEIAPPVLLSDNACLQRDCVLRGSVIIGHDALIDSGNTFERCVVFNHTYVGKNMEFVNKIVTPSRIIDPIHNAWVSLHEPGVTSSLPGAGRGGRFDFCAVVEYFLAGLLAAVYALPWAVHFLLRCLRCRRTALTLFRRMALDWYSGYWAVLAGKARLMARGEHPEERAVMHYSDSLSLKRDAAQQHLDDCYFRHRCTPGKIIRIVGQALLRRLIAAY